MDDRYGQDVLAAGWRDVGKKTIPTHEATRDLVVEEVVTGFCGAVIRIEKNIVTLEDRHGKLRLFPLGPGFLIDGEPVVLTRPTAAAPAGRARTAGSMCTTVAPWLPQTARKQVSFNSSRIQRIGRIGQVIADLLDFQRAHHPQRRVEDRKSTRLNSSHVF